MIASTAGDDLQAKRIQRKINEHQKALREFSKDNDLVYDTKRATVEGYRKISTSDLKKLETNAIIKEIEEGKYPLTINPEKQNRHIIGTKEYTQGRSYLTISVKNAQQIIETKYKNGVFLFSESGRWKNKVLIVADDIIGVNVDAIETTITKSATIHFSKSGTHLVPRKDER